MAYDVISDLMRRIERAVSESNGQYTSELAQKIEQQARQDWGGKRVAISSIKAERMAARHERIQSAWAAGERDVDVLARRFGVSVRQVYRIVNGA